MEEGGVVLVERAYDCDGGERKFEEGKEAGKEVHVGRGKGETAGVRMCSGRYGSQVFSELRYLIETISRVGSLV